MSRRADRPPSLPLATLLVGIAAVVGCQSSVGPRWLNPFHRPERSTVMTPPQRIEAIRAVASQSTGADTPEQRALLAPLIQQLPDEPDPLIRQAILETAGAFTTPLATQALTAGLQDTDTHVRQACCRQLGRRSDHAAAPTLVAIAKSDKDFDVRVAATRALGSSGANRGELVALLKDRDPAMQLAAVEAMRQLTGQDLGGDVAAYVALAEGTAAPTAAPPSETRVAGRRFGWLPFF